jgi:DNA-binding transcriptional MocR family regulator
MTDLVVAVDRRLAATRARWGARRYRLLLGQREAAALKQVIAQRQGLVLWPGVPWHWRGYEVVEMAAPQGVVVHWDPAEGVL